MKRNIFSTNKVQLLIFLLPAFLIVLLFYIIPIIITVYVSFTPMRNWNIDKYFNVIVGLQNYNRLFSLITRDPVARQVVVNTIVFVAITLVINVLGGLGLALANFFIDERVSTGFRTLWLLPRMTPIAVYGLLWYYFFHGSNIGMLNSIAMSLGLIKKPIAWGQEVIPWGPWSIIIIVNGFVGVSFGMVIFYSALKSIPRELIIAARVDGASNWKLTTNILIPLLRWHLLFVTTWQLLSLLTTYAHTFLLVEWGVVSRTYGQTWALYVFNTAFGRGEQDQGLAAAAAVILVIFGAILGWITVRALGFNKMITKPKGDI